MRTKILISSTIILGFCAALEMSCNNDDSEVWDGIEYSTNANHKATRAAEPGTTPPSNPSLNGDIEDGSTSGKAFYSGPHGNITLNVQLSWPPRPLSQCDNEEISCTYLGYGSDNIAYKVEDASCNAHWDLRSESISYTFSFNLLYGNLDPITGNMSWQSLGAKTATGSTSISSYITYH